LAAGLNREQIVCIYGFEAGGNGDYDVQAGLEYNKRARAITTALGYNQLLATNTIEIVAESGNHFVKSLSARMASLPGGEGGALERTIAIVRKMIGFSRSVADDWNEHQALANTQKGLGIHALNLDLDVGPLLQAQKLMDSVVFARRKGIGRTLTAAELEMMNLTGDGNGLEQRLPGQSGSAKKQRCREADRGHRRAHGSGSKKTRGEGIGGGAAVKAAAPRFRRAARRSSWKPPKSSARSSRRRPACKWAIRSACRAAAIRPRIARFPRSSAMC
jgi:hypothetical protein